MSSTKELDRLSLSVGAHFRRVGRFIGRRWGVVTLIGMSSYIVVRVLSIQWKVRAGAESVIGLSIEPVGNVLDSLFAGAVLGLIAYALRDELKDWLEQEVRMVKTQHFDSLEECLSLLAEEMNKFKDCINSAHVTVVSPLLFSDEYIDYYYDSPTHALPNSDVRTKKNNAKHALHEFAEIMDAIIEEGNGAYDQTTLGKTDIKKIDKASYEVAKRAYMVGTGNVPGSTELALHDNLNEYATFIFGICDPSARNHSEPAEFRFMLLVHFDPNFRKLCGYICRDKQTIKQNYEFVSFKREQARINLVSSGLNPAPLDEWERFCGQMHRFFCGESAMIPPQVKAVRAEDHEAV